MKRTSLKFLIAMLALLALMTSLILSLRGSSPANPKVEQAKEIRPVPNNVGRPDRLIEEAENRIKREPDKFEGYNLLGLAYLQKARETGDFSLNARAESALTHSLEMAPDNYEAIKLQAVLLLAYHRFGEGLEVARQAQQMQPRDHLNYGAMTDALVELGRYPEADQAIEQMISLRPDASSYARLSYLYFLHGNQDRAIEVMRAAVQSSTSQDAEGLAWCRVHLAEELLRGGQRQAAEREVNTALQELPDYHLALAAKARLRLADSDFQSAIEFYLRAQSRVPLPDTAIALGNIYTLTGQAEEAKKQFDFVEFLEKSGAKETQTYSRQLALFWANHEIRLPDALEAMKREYQWRKDIYTCDALAWCYFKNDHLKEAETSIAEALRLGTRDAQIHYHAGMIYNASGEKQRARHHLQLALAIDPGFDILQSSIARQRLAELRK